MYAGKSLMLPAQRSDCWDHPRVCGEKSTSEAQKSSDMGSPPRMRGKDADPHTKLRRYGITPAYAGKRAWFSYCGCQDRDHPRVCGEKALSTFSSRKNSGSPPRMRGKVLCGRSSAGRHGITPAYAEKRGRTIRVNRTVKDYPRVCGEKMVSMIPHRRSRGSPPRMRGKAHDGRQVLRGLRRHLKCDWDGHLRLVQVGNVVHERALMPDVHESQSRRTPQRRNDRMGQPVQAGMYGGSHGCRGRAAAPKCPLPGSERYPFHPLR